jgi:hypothetical protein
MFLTVKIITYHAEKQNGKLTSYVKTKIWLQLA